MRKYPRTPYWPTSPSGGRMIADTLNFVGQEVVVTEKLDGGNTLLHNGEVYARSVSSPSRHPWHAMVRRHHAWKLAGLDNLYLYGEDIYGVHSIEYDPLTTGRLTFRAFAARVGDTFISWDDFYSIAFLDHFIPIVPILWRGIIESEEQMNDYLADWHTESSVLGGEREGVVIRVVNEFHTDRFGAFVCKSVRENHVQIDAHWTRNWKACAIERGGE